MNQNVNDELLGGKRTFVTAAGAAFTTGQTHIIDRG